MFIVALLVVGVPRMRDDAIVDDERLHRGEARACSGLTRGEHSCMRATGARSSTGMRRERNSAIVIAP
jgi:hypothetical protein